MFSTCVWRHSQRAVVRHFEGGWLQVLFSTGEVCVRQPDSALWIQISPSGERRAFTIEGHEIDLPPLHCAENLDPQTGGRVITREDYVMTVVYPDRSTLVQHADGTRFWTETESNNMPGEEIEALCFIL